MSVHKTPEEMQTAFRQLTGVNEANQGVAEGSGSDVEKILQAIKQTKQERADWVRRGMDVSELDQDLDALEAQLADAEQRWQETDRPMDEEAHRDQSEMQRLRELAGMPPMAMPSVTEGGVKNWVDDLYYEFNERYDLPRDINDDAYLSVVAKFLNSQGIDPDKIEDIGELFLDMRDHDEDADLHRSNDPYDIDDPAPMESADPGREIDYTSLVVDGIDTRDYPDFSDAYFASGEYMDGTPLPDDVLDNLSRDGDLLYKYIEKRLYEAEYQGRNVPLGKPMQGDVKKFKVYVKDPSTGNVKKVNFGDKTMRIKKSNPKRRKSFRARHNCANPGPRTKARYWSCRKW